MRGSAFARRPPRPDRSEEFASFSPKPRTPALARSDTARLVVQIPKQEPIQHQGYMALVRKLSCARCQCSYTIPGAIQFCHRDEGKGMGIKTDCREGWPGCPTCHWVVGTSGALSKAERRAFELKAGAETRAWIRELGVWPKSLPHWPADEVEA